MISPFIKFHPIDRIDEDERTFAAQIAVCLDEIILQMIMNGKVSRLLHLVDPKCCRSQGRLCELNGVNAIFHSTILHTTIYSSRQATIADRISVSTTTWKTSLESKPLPSTKKWPNQAFGGKFVAVRRPR